MKWILLPFAIIVYILMRWCEMGAKVFGRLNEKYLDMFTKPNNPK